MLFGVTVFKVVCPARLVQGSLHRQQPFSQLKDLLLRQLCTPAPDNFDGRVTFSAQDVAESIQRLLSAPGNLSWCHKGYEILACNIVLDATLERVVVVQLALSPAGRHYDVSSKLPILAHTQPMLRE